ncbi:MAG: hypothetical protein AVDCRST_MAG06-3041, partial [uncultured Nocardioides sp.]
EVRRVGRGAAQRRRRRRRRPPRAPRRPPVAARADRRARRDGAAPLPARAAPGVRRLRRGPHLRRRRRPERPPRPAPRHPDDQRPRPREPAPARRQPGGIGLRPPHRRVAGGPGHARVRPRPDPAGRLQRLPVHQRLRRHLPQPVAPLLLRPLLLPSQRRGLPRPPESRCLSL